MIGASVTLSFPFVFSISLFKRDDNTNIKLKTLHQNDMAMENYFRTFHTGNQRYVSILEENKSNLIESIIVLDEGNGAKENIAKSM
jgi:hypothetical protein